VRLFQRALRKRRIGWPCALAAATLIASPVAAAARPEHGSPRAVIAGAGGTVYGGVSAQNFPVVIETNKSGRKVLKASIAIRLTCTSAATATVPDRFAAMSVSKKRKFRASFGPETSRNDDGTTTDFEGSISGAFNKARTKVSGKWSFKATDHDASGAVTDTCDSGSVSWNAKQ
jgi:hypothetical protein